MACSSCRKGRTCVVFIDVKTNTGGGGRQLARKNLVLAQRIRERGGCKMSCLVYHIKVARLFQLVLVSH
jgi:hypothetical protein